MPLKPDTFYEQAAHLKALMNSDPAEALKQARRIDLDTSGPERLNLMMLRASALVDGGAMQQQRDAIEEGLALFRELHDQCPTNTDITYNLANALIAIADDPPHDPSWLDHQERTRAHRAEARRCFWNVVQDTDASGELRTQAWTNLGNQFANSYRFSEAHDARLAALKVDPQNGVAAASAANSLLRLYQQGGCSDLTRVEAIMLAKMAHRHKDRIIEYAGVQAAEQIAAFASELEDPPPRPAHTDPFVAWVEHERLTLAPTVELIDPTLSKLDWLVLSGIREPMSDASGMPPPIFAMFNVLKGDFILARDLAWRALDEDAWPTTGRFADTLDYATYGPNTSALVLAHRAALDLLDKVAVTANYYFDLGQPVDRIYFGKLWRDNTGKAPDRRPLAEGVEKVIRSGATALYGLVELAEDYDGPTGILRSQKDLRNTGTHRFLVLHDLGDPTRSRQTPEIERHWRDPFIQEVLRALRVARSAIQMLALSIAQHEQGLVQQTDDVIGLLAVPDHDWIRGRHERPHPPGRIEE
jgi:tetratricopeptide (TPR) repeat protein